MLDMDAYRYHIDTFKQQFYVYDRSSVVMGEAELNVDDF